MMKIEEESRPDIHTEVGKREDCIASVAITPNRRKEPRRHGGKRVIRVGVTRHGLRAALRTVSKVGDDFKALKRNMIIDNQRAKRRKTEQRTKVHLAGSTDCVFIQLMNASSQEDRQQTTTMKVAYKQKIRF
jgi:hypothetical protein